MWLPLHIRHSVTRRIAFATAIFCCALQSGCGTLPRLSAPPIEQFANRSPDEIPRPDFETAQEDRQTDRTQSPRVATSNPGRGIVAEPKPFAWEVLGRSTDGRPVKGIRIGNGGYRVLIVGSLAGSDPEAIKLTEQLAQHVHENSIILGGVQTTVVRTANPDAEFGKKTATPLNRQFPAGPSSIAKAKETGEIRLLLDLIKTTQPQRIIHIRTYPGATGVVAATSGTAAPAKDIAEWHDMNFVALPGKSREGTLERYIATGNTCDIVTFAFPSESGGEPVWEQYGDALLNLLLDEDFETRKLAREQLRPRSERDRNRQ